MTKNRTSMADIAAHAGVSTATVSRVFNGVGQVSAETRRRVLTAIDELGYDRPSPERTPSTPSVPKYKTTASSNTPTEIRPPSFHFGNDTFPLIHALLPRNARN